MDLTRALRGRWAVVGVATVIVVVAVAVTAVTEKGSPRPTPRQAATASPAQEAPQRVVEMCLRPTVARVDPGQETTLEVVVAPQDQPVAGVQALLAFDPALLEALEVRSDPDSPLEVALSSQVDNETGIVTFAAGTFAASPPREPFVAADVVLKGLKPGVAQVEFVTEGLRKSAASVAGRQLLRRAYGATVTVGQASAQRPPETGNPCAE